MPLPSALGPHCVGTRVVVRRLLPGETGPSGGPAMTDLLGVMESWTAEATTVRAEDGTTTEIALADIVSGKPVPLRPSVRSRVPADEACRISHASWPSVHTEPLGDWLLRASGGFSARANSVMAVGDPGVRFEAAVDRVHAFYAEHALVPWVQVVVGSATADRFTAAGWVTARPGEADSHFQVASVAQAARAVRRRVPAAPPSREIHEVVTPAWLATDERARTHGADALAVLEGPDQVGFVQVGSVQVGSVQVGSGRAGEGLAARARVTCDGDWSGLTDVWVRPDQRRSGLGLVLLDVALDWAGERGAGTTYLQVRGDNAAALALYAGLGFSTHHTYRYLAPPEPR